MDGTAEISIVSLPGKYCKYYGKNDMTMFVRTPGLLIYDRSHHQSSWHGTPASVCQVELTRYFQTQARLGKLVDEVRGGTVLQDPGDMRKSARRQGIQALLPSIPCMHPSMEKENKTEA